MQEVVMLKYNKENVHAVADLSNVAHGVAAPSSIHRILPGWNEFPKRVWDQYASHPDFVGMLKDGTIEIMTKGKKKEPIVAQDEFELSKFDESTAIKLVADTQNRHLLQRWLDSETRGKVKKAIDKQLKPLLPGASDGE